MTGPAPDRELYLVGNAHLDPVWLWRWTEGFQEARATLTSAVTLLEENPDYVFTFDQVALLEWVEEADPALFARVRRAVADGRLEIVGGWWVEPDCNLAGGESYVRQGLLGQRYLREKLGITATIGCNIDPFGHNGMLPQILRGQGLRYYCFLRPGPHESAMPDSALRWRSPDGSEVIAYRIPHEYQSSDGDLAYHVEKAVNQVRSTTDHVMVLYGVGNHGGGPTRENLRAIAELDRRGSFGRLRLSRMADYFELLAQDADRLPVWETDLQMHAPGCYSAASDVKALFRRAEQELLRAERLAVTAQHLAGAPAPADELRQAWKQLLFNAFHDTLPGSAIEEALDDARHQLGEVISIADRATNRAVQAIARDTEVAFEAATLPILVFNPHPHAATVPVEVETSMPHPSVVVVDHHGTTVPSQLVQPAATVGEFGGKWRYRLLFPADLPPLGHTLYRIRPQRLAVRTSDGALSATQTTLANDVLEAEVDPRTGWLSRLLHKPSGIDVLGGAGGCHTVVSDDDSDTWGHRVRSYVLGGQAFRPEAVELVEDGPLRATIRVVSRCRNSRLVEWFSLGSGSDGIRVRVELDWREARALLKLRFPTALADPAATFEIPFGHQRRVTDGTERPGQSWVHLAGSVEDRRCGLLVLNTSKLAYDVTGADLGITVVRSPVYAWHDPVRLVEGGQYSYQAQGLQRFGYELVPHAGELDLTRAARRAAMLLMPPVTMFEAAHEGRLQPRTVGIDADDGPVVVTAVKAAEDDPRAVVVRAVNPTAQRARARIRLHLLETVVDAEFRPFEIRTFLVSVDGEVRSVDLLEDPLHDEVKEERHA